MPAVTNRTLRMIPPCAAWEYPAGVSRWPLASIALAACYSPSVPLGAPCNPGDACPDGQACIASKCVIAPTGGVDAAAMPGDRDDDGVSDVADNCADVANADQANEDGDTFGDACDPCPPVADSAPAVDTDGDGVADACDPNPQVPGDKIALFEGFHHGVPNWARSLHWTAATDAVRVASPNDSTVEFLVLPIADLDRITLSAQVVIEQTIPGGDDDIDLVVPEDVNNDEGVDCELYEPPGGMANRQLALFDDLKNGGDDLSSTLLAWTNNTAYKLVLTRRGTSFTCSAAGTAAPLLLGTSTTKGGTDPAAVIRAYGLTAHVDWVMVVRSP
jgi:hypothetical protein